MHEAGHGLYEAGARTRRSPGPRSRSRARSGCTSPRAGCGRTGSRAGAPTSAHLLPKLRERFPDQLGGVDLDELERAANRVERSLIRIEADEVTYNLHILIRFELELEIFDGELELARAARGLERALPRLPRPRGPRRRPRRAPGRALVGRGLRLLPHLQPRQRDRRPALGGGGARHARPRGADRRRRAGPARRVAARTACTATAAGSRRRRSWSGRGAASSQSSRCWAICRPGPARLAAAPSRGPRRLGRSWGTS